MANAFDWLLVKKAPSESIVPPSPGAMANPFLGLMMLCFVFMGLVFFDGFMGFSYLASLFVRGVMPTDLYEEAFSCLHKRKNLPEIELSGDVSSVMSVDGMSVASRSVRSGKSARSTRSGKSTESSVDEEIAALLGTTGSKLEMSSLK